MAVHGTADNALELPNESKHHYGAEPSFHRSASQRNAALVLVRAYVTLNTSKTAYKRFKMITARDYPNILTISVL